MDFETGVGSDRWDRAVLGLRNYEEGKAFESRVAELYRLQGYEVQHGRLFGGRQVDLLLTGYFGDLTVYRAIECKAGPVKAEHIDSFIAKLRRVQDEYPAALGTIITDASFSDAITTQAAREGIQLTLFRDLAAKLLDGVKYAQHLIEEVESNERYLLKLYVEPFIGNDISGDHVPAFEFLIREWLEDPEWQQLTLLGDVGTGKSFLSRMLAYTLAKQHLRNPVESPVPILIDLRNAEREFSLEGLILTHFARKGLARVSYDVFRYALTHGNVLLILDGFDEMAARVTPQVTSRNFSELARASEGRAKVLLTCRTHYFKSRTEEEEIILGSRTEYGSETARDLYWDLISRRGFKIAYLRAFKYSQIEQYVKKATGEKADEALLKIRTTYNLLELSHRPMLLDMIVRSLDKLTSADINAAVLYQVFTDAWIHRDKWRDVLAPELKLELLISLARSLWVQDAPTIHYTALEAHLRGELATRIQDPRQFVEIDNEIRTASFLTRDANGNFGFAHKSYAEYFVARFVADELTKGDVQCLKARKLTPEIISFLRYMVDLEAVDLLLSDQLRSEYLPLVSENALICMYGLKLRVEKESACSQVESGEPVIIKLPRGMNLNGAQLEGVVLEGADIETANLSGSNLSQAALAGAILSQVNLSEALGEKANFALAKLTDCDLTGANLRGASFESAELIKVEFQRADLTESYLWGAKCVETGFLDAVLLRAVLPDELMAPVEFWNAVEELRSWMHVVARLPDFGYAAESEDIVSDVIIRLSHPRNLQAFIAMQANERKATVYTMIKRRVAEERTRRRVDPRRSIAREYSNFEDPVEFSLDVRPNDFTDEEFAQFETELADDSREDTILEQIDLDVFWNRMQAKLAPKAYAVFYARVVYGLSVREIANRLQMSERQAHRLLTKGREIAAEYTKVFE